MVTALERALDLSREIEQFPLGRCGPSDDLDMQTAYLYSFLDMARPFVAAVKRIGDPVVSQFEIQDQSDPDWGSCSGCAELVTVTEI
jgi:hypothetical protein